MAEDDDHDELQSLLDLLPLSLVRSHFVPPSPNPSRNSLSFLPDFAGFSWIAYGAASLVVVKHFPSPLSKEETENPVGSVFFQAIEPDALPKGRSFDPLLPELEVRAVRWYPKVPSDGTLAVGLGNCVDIYSPLPDSTKGSSFIWKQVDRLVQAIQVEAIEWAGSGDGLVISGSGIVVWKRMSTSWEVLWRSNIVLPQDLLCVTHSVHGLVATAARIRADEIRKNRIPMEEMERRIVLVWCNNTECGVAKVELKHPQPVLMIQWRPCQSKHTSQSTRDVLLTCCLDGTVRLWTAIDSGRGARHNKATSDTRLSKESFYVSAVIESNQYLNGFSSESIFVAWASENRSVNGNAERVIQRSLAEKDHNLVGRCDWLVAVCPDMSVTLWAIHCLDDISPLRFPRVHLWRKFKARVHDSLLGNQVLERNNILISSSITRNSLFAPPISCSFLSLVHSGSFSWTHLEILNAKETDKLSSSTSSGHESIYEPTHADLLQDGHSGSIVLFLVHPCRYEVDLAASLDSNGYVLIWSLSMYSNFHSIQPPIFQSPWNCLGRILVHDDCLKIQAQSMVWVPYVVNGNVLLLIGHDGGVDCFIIGQNNQNSVGHHKICTFSFPREGLRVGPSLMYTFPIPCSVSEKVTSYSFTLTIVRADIGEVICWNCSLCLSDSNQMLCDVSPPEVGVDDSNPLVHEFTFHSKKYCFSAKVSPTKFPGTHSYGQLTGFSFPDDDGALVPSFLDTGDNEKEGSLDGFPACRMATGHSDGSVRLWELSNVSERTSSPTELECLSWHLVGFFRAHEEAVSFISLSTHCGKIATVGIDSPDGVHSINIWSTLNSATEGSLYLEEKIVINASVISLKWLVVGDGNILLGVCLQNELRIYSQKLNLSWDPIAPCDAQKAKEHWCCIASVHTHSIEDFVWGPKASIVIIHRRYFSIISQWPLTCHSAASNTSCPEYFVDHATEYHGKRNHEVDPKYDWKDQINMGSLLGVSDKMHKPLPLFHPKVLILSMFSGKWERVLTAVEHLVAYLESANEETTTMKGQSLGNISSSIPQLDLSKYFKVAPSARVSSEASDYRSSLFQLTDWASMATSVASNDREPSTGSQIKKIISTLENSPGVLGLSDRRRNQILAIMDILVEVSDECKARTYQSFDESARRFWVAVRFKQQFLFRTYKRAGTAQDFSVDSQLIAWAFQSECQENLMSSLLSSDPSWLEMRNLGVGYWFTNAPMLRTRMEKLARAQFLRNRDPKESALLYVALNRITVLAGLFKVSRDEKDKSLVAFLSRNFQEERHKEAALKNAYVLMGRHQLELAATFFLLGGDISSAVTVCAKNLGDEQLALVVARLVEGSLGRIECDLISNYILPASISQGDYWLASMLEWTLGNYSKSFSHLLYDLLSNVSSGGPTITGAHPAFSDPNIGQYCVMLALKSSMKNSIGDYSSFILAKMATLVSSSAFARCGLPIQALDCFLSLSYLGGKGRADVPKAEQVNLASSLLESKSSTYSKNWVSKPVMDLLESYTKLSLAMRCISKLISEFPFWQWDILKCGEPLITWQKNTLTHHDLPLVEFENKFQGSISSLQREYSLKKPMLMNLVLVFACNNGKLFTGWHILHTCGSTACLEDAQHEFLCRTILHIVEGICYSFSRSIVVHGISVSAIRTQDLSTIYEDVSKGNHSYENLLDFMQSIVMLRPILKHIGGALQSNDFHTKSSLFLDYMIFCLCIGLSWVKRNYGVLLMTQSIFSVQRYSSDNISHFLSSDDLDKLLNRGKKILHSGESSLIPFANEERSMILGVCLWQLLFSFTKNQVLESSEWAQQLCLCTDSSVEPSQDNDQLDCSKPELCYSLPILSGKILINAVSYIVSGLTKELAFYLGQKLEGDLEVFTLSWLEGSVQPQVDIPQLQEPRNRLHEMTSSEEVIAFKDLWYAIARPQLVEKLFVQERNSFSKLNVQKHADCWSSLQNRILVRNDQESAICQQVQTDNNSSSSHAGERNDSDSSLANNSRQSREKNQSPLSTILANSFRTKEILRRNGELLEAICVNSCNQEQFALASSRKGLIFSQLSLETSKGEDEYIWSDSDWPQNGWAGFESTPLPTFVSEGVGLGIRKGTHLGLGGATVGLGPLARPGKDLTGGGAFGIPGYAGMGASGLGWGEQEDFEEYIDPPATLDNISTRALCSHPSRPLFLVGSSNTHIYLWEFYREKATATYGILPAANVPPPYALASITALRFDRYGHRFASAALDGTVCTWQLEVGGRSNVHPTESSLCFRDHASDVTYLGSSGSVVAAAGASSNNMNVVIWDTLAPASSSRISLRCHEGGARSLAVLENDVGSSSVSPLIITGGEGGDFGLHDFRYVATGKSKHHKIKDRDVSPILDNSKAETPKKSGNQNHDGMVWYIPKAHQGSITRISAIPDTSLFLTGSKDGDIKLWDAKRQELVRHWPRIHDKHTFLQPSFQGFGGVVRAAVTDIQVVPYGFLSCGGDGAVRFVELVNP